MPVPTDQHAEQFLKDGEALDRCRVREREGGGLKVRRGYGMRAGPTGALKQAGVLGCEMGRGTGHPE